MANSSAARGVSETGFPAEDSVSHVAATDVLRTEVPSTGAACGFGVTFDQAAADRAQAVHAAAEQARKDLMPSGAVAGLMWVLRGYAVAGIVAVLVWVAYGNIALH